MNKSESKGLSRRDLIKSAGAVAAASALAGVAVPFVHAAESNTIQVALVGCGGRGTGAIGNALNSKNGPIKLVAMADVFEDKLESSHKNLSGDDKIGKKVDVPEDRKFIGFDGYKKAMDCLKPGDVVILATPPAFRWVHFTYAIEKGLNVFMEKPVTVDGPTTRKMLKLGEESVKKNLKVGVGLMCRHCDVRGELFKRIKDGEIGDITLLRAYRMKGPEADCFTNRTPEGMSELECQIRKFHGFLWASGGCYSDFLIHNIDECCWMKDAWPVKAQATGGRHYRGAATRRPELRPLLGRVHLRRRHEAAARGPEHGRLRPAGVRQLRHGTKGAAVISTLEPHAGPVAHPDGLRPHQEGRRHLARAAKDEPNPYQLEWDDLLDAIRNDKPYNEVKRGAEASLVASMGRMAAHTGQLDHVGRDPQLRARVRAGRGQAGAGRPGAAAGRQGRPISGAAAGHA